ncbi:hypothetical protein BU14_0071s0037 [Porphyra umbilicalis]|uniref:Cytochrome P450 n=1 Tax=Porphyra umbilicalis TaxID=2786 RepID=A0A1X6PFZ1_PORUM|nr:hypothetical protein BU14_0071s0037 [Porphyra umbilicalis]|eukprot:OSX79782.1 hypothetical protein BU14_0071s0037 [Porphyra umbilicalis]
MSIGVWALTVRTAAPVGLATPRVWPHASTIHSSRLPSAADATIAASMHAAMPPLPTSPEAMAALFALALLTAAAVASVIRYRVALRGTTPSGSPPLGGTAHPLPLLGDLPRLVADPARLWAHLTAAAAAHPTRAAAACLGGGRLALLLTHPADVRAVVCRGGPAWAHTLHPNATAVFGAANVVLVGGAAHAATRRALGAPVLAAAAAQRDVVDAAVGGALRRWAAAGEPAGAAGAAAGRRRVRALGLDVLEAGWLGRPVYTGREGARAALTADVAAVAGGFTCLPFDLPGTALRRAVAARRRLVAALTCRVGEALAAARSAAATGRPAAAAAPPRAMVDVWAAAVAGGDPAAVLPPAVVADVLLDAVLAVTDGLAAGVLGLLGHLAARPAVVAAIRAEARTPGGGGGGGGCGSSSSDGGGSGSGDSPAAAAAVAASLAAAPPAPYVPATARRRVTLPSGLRVPAGALVLPALGAAGLPFGGGAHACLGRGLAGGVLRAVAVAVAVEVELVPTVGGGDGGVDYLPCAFPREATYVVRPRGGGRMRRRGWGGGSAQRSGAWAGGAMEAGCDGRGVRWTRGAMDAGCDGRGRDVRETTVHAAWPW